MADSSSDEQEWVGEEMRDTAMEGESEEEEEAFIDEEEEFIDEEDEQEQEEEEEYLDDEEEEFQFEEEDSPSDESEDEINSEEEAIDSEIAVRRSRRLRSKGRVRLVDDSSEEDDEEEEEGVPQPRRGGRPRRSHRARQQINYEEESSGDDADDVAQWVVEGPSITIDKVMDHRRILLPLNWGASDDQKGQYLAIREENGLVGGAEEELLGKHVNRGETKEEKTGEQPGSLAKRYTTQYLIKWENASYLWATWETGQALMSGTFRGFSLKGQKKFDNYKKKTRMLMDQERLAKLKADSEGYLLERNDLLSRRLQCAVVERVVAYRPKSSATLSPAQEALQESLPPTARAKEDDPMAAEDGPGGQYLCKWRDLPYKEATWETWENVYSHTPEPEALKKSVNAFLQRRRDKIAAPPPREPKRSERMGLYKTLSDHIGIEHLEGKEGEGSHRSTGLWGHPKTLEGGQLRDYQVKGVDWLVRKWAEQRNVILADEMGLGKTVQCIGLLSIISALGVEGPHLVVVPLSTIANWLREFEKWAPTLNVIVYIGDGDSRKEIRHHEWVALQRSIVLTTYDMVTRDSAVFKEEKWRHLIVDEAHRLRNPSSTLYAALSAFEVESIVLLTGTPLQNSLTELWGLLHFLHPADFPTAEEFLAKYSALELDADEASNELSGHDLTEAALNARRGLDEVLAPLLLRRDKRILAALLPPKHNLILPVPPSQTQRKYYRWIVSRNVDQLQKAGAEFGAHNIVMELRKCCNHPFLIRGAREALTRGQRAGNPSQVAQQLVEHSSKMVILDKLLVRLKEKNHRVLIFSQMVRMLDLLSEFLTLKGYNFQRIDGGTAQLQRQSAIDHFNAPGSEDFCFLLSTRAGGLGINLATADTVVIFDSDWNPQNDLQAESRAHRLGQKNTVRVFRLVTSNTVEEKTIERAKEKLILDHLVIQASSRGVLSAGAVAELERRARGKNTKISNEEFGKILQFGLRDLFHLDKGKSTESSTTPRADESPDPAAFDIDAILEAAERERVEMETEAKRQMEALAQGEPFTAMKSGGIFESLQSQFRVAHLQPSEQKSSEQKPSTADSDPNLLQSIKAYKPPEDEDLAVLEATTPLPGAESEEDISSALQHLEYSSDEDGVKSTGKSRKSRKRPQSAKVEEEEEESDFTTLDRAGATAEEEDVRKALSLFRKYGATPLSHPVESPTYLCEAYGWTFSQPFIAALSDAASGLSRPVEDMEDICGTLLGIALAQIGCPRTGKVGSHISELVPEMDSMLPTDTNHRKDFVIAETKVNALTFVKRILYLQGLAETISSMAKVPQEGSFQELAPEAQRSFIHRWVAQPPVPYKSWKWEIHPHFWSPRKDAFLLLLVAKYGLGSPAQIGNHRALRYIPDTVAATGRSTSQDSGYDTLQAFEMKRSVSTLVPLTSDEMAEGGQDQEDPEERVPNESLWADPIPADKIRRRFEQILSALPSTKHWMEVLGLTRKSRAKAPAAPRKKSGSRAATAVRKKPRAQPGERRQAKPQRRADRTAATTKKRGQATMPALSLPEETDNPWFKAAPHQPATMIQHLRGQQLHQEILRLVDVMPSPFPIPEFGDGEKAKETQKAWCKRMLCGVEDLAVKLSQLGNLRDSQNALLYTVDLPYVLSKAEKYLRDLGIRVLGVSLAIRRHLMEKRSSGEEEGEFSQKDIENMEGKRMLETTLTSQEVVRVMSRAEALLWHHIDSLVGHRGTAAAFLDVVEFDERQVRDRTTAKAAALSPEQNKGRAIQAAKATAPNPKAPPAAKQAVSSTFSGPQPSQTSLSSPENGARGKPSLWGAALKRQRV